MPAVNPGELRYDGIILRDADFVAAKDDSTELSPGTVGEIATAEIGEDGQLSGYDALRLGDNPDRDDPTKGKLFHSWADTAAADLPNNTEVRFAFADKNRNRREPATPWMPLRDLDRDRPDHRVALRPRTKRGKPWFVKMGREVIVEIKNESQSITPSLSDSSMETPARGGF